MITTMQTMQTEQTMQTVPTAAGQVRGARRCSRSVQ